MDIRSRSNAGRAALLHITVLVCAASPFVRAAPTITPESGFVVTFLGYGPVGNPVPTNNGTDDNIALSSAAAVAFADSVIQGYPGTHEVAHLNNGLYGNDQSWIGGGGTVAAGIDMPGSDSYVVSAFAFGRDNVGGYTDRSLGTYKVYRTLVTTGIQEPGSPSGNPPATPVNALSITSDPNTGWQLMATITVNSETDHQRRRLFSINDTRMTGLMITTPNGSCIDEIEIYAGGGKVQALPPTDVAASSGTLNGRLNETAGNTYVWVGYGPSDGATNKPGMPGAWQNWIPYDGGTPQSTGLLNYAVAGLNTETHYYYAFYASNSTWQAWSTSASFETPWRGTDPGLARGYHTQRMKITFAGYDPPGESDDVLTNFPALVVFAEGVGGNFSYSGFKSKHAYDLRFSADGVTALPYEIEGDWTPGVTNHIWVRVPELVGTNSHIWAYWGNSRAAQAPYTTNGTVWSTGYEAVWHFSSFNQNIAINSSCNAGLDGTGAGITVSTEAPVGNGFTWGEAGDYVGIADNPVLYGHNEMTWSCWLKIRSQGSGNDYGRIIDSPNYHLITENSSTTYVSDLNGLNQNRLTGTIPDQTWVYFTHVNHASTGRSFYTNGIVQVAPTGPHLPVGTTAGITYIGNSPAHGQTLDRAFDGSMDEWRISSVARSPDWIWAEYMNMASNSSFNLYGRVMRTGGTVITVH